MCGRFTLTSPASRLVEFFELLEPDVELGPRYNIAPTQPVAAIRSVDGFRQLSLFRWGLLPHFARSIGEGARMINARSETAATKPAFSKAFEKRRCLIPADGFFEWKKTGESRQPHLIRMASREPFAMAGLWERWRDPETEERVETCSVLTTQPNSLMAQLHDRMPVILDDEASAAWLDPKAAIESLQSLLKPCPADQLESFPVHRCVGNVRNDDVRCITRVETHTQQSLF